jgi:hypothetical protein
MRDVSVCFCLLVSASVRARRAQLVDVPSVAKPMGSGIGIFARFLRKPWHLPVATRRYLLLAQGRIRHAFGAGVSSRFGSPWSLISCPAPPGSS